MVNVNRSNSKGSTWTINDYGRFISFQIQCIQYNWSPAIEIEAVDIPKFIDDLKWVYENRSEVG
jgi:hypothetical protein